MDNDDEESFGLERGWYERTVAYYSERDRFDFSIAPAKRTMAQKFELSTLVALTELKALGWFSHAQENAYLSSDFFQILKSESRNTWNAATFALVMSCYDFALRALMVHAERALHTIPELLDAVRQPPSRAFDEFCKKYGITVPDLLRYIDYVESIAV